MAHTYDYAIIGSGLSGLILAAALSQETKNVALIEAADVPFGANKKVQFPSGPINNGLRFVPGSVLAESALSFLEGLLRTPLVAKICEEAPVTYEGGYFKPFLGFGDTPPAFYEELSYFTASKHMELALEPHEWTRALFEKFQGNFLPRSYVTRFHQEDDRVSHVTINGAKLLHAHNFIFTGAVKDLSVLLPENSISIRARTKLAKNTYWTALCLDLCHSNRVTDSTAVHVLNGTTQDEIGPCVGRFQKPVEVGAQQLQASQWMTFIEQEVTEDSEVVGMALKKIKRQIKRAYPEALDNLKLERIFIAPVISGSGDLKLSANMSLPDLKNLWIASPTVHEQKNLLGALLQAKVVISALGFQTGSGASDHHPVRSDDESFAPGLLES